MHINNTPKTKKKIQTKTILSPQGPQWSSHSVARVQRRGDIPLHHVCGNQEI